MSLSRLNVAPRIDRSTHRRFSVKKGALKNFGNFTGKQLYWSLFLIRSEDPQIN